MIMYLKGLLWIPLLHLLFAVDAIVINICEEMNYTASTGYFISPCYPEQVPMMNFNCSCTVKKIDAAIEVKFTANDVSYCDCCSEELRIGNFSNECHDQCPSKCVPSNVSVLEYIIVSDHGIPIEYTKVINQNQEITDTGRINISFESKQGDNEANVTISCQKEISDFSPLCGTTLSTSSVTPGDSTVTATLPSSLHSEGSTSLNITVEYSQPTWSTGDAERSTTRIDNRRDVGVTAGISVGAAIVVIAVIVLAVLLTKRKDQQKKQSPVPNGHASQSRNQSSNDYTSSPQSGGTDTELIENSMYSSPPINTEDIDTEIIENDLYSSTNNNTDNGDTDIVDNAMYGSHDGSCNDSTYYSAGTQMVDNTLYSSETKTDAGNTIDRFSGTELLENAMYGGGTIPDTPLYSGGSEMVDNAMYGTTESQGKRATIFPPTKQAKVKTGAHYIRNNYVNVEILN